MTLTAAHELTIFLIAFWGYSAILLTGEFSAPILWAAYALGLAAYVAKKRNAEAPRWMWNLLSVGAFIIAAAMATQKLLDATVYLFTFLQAIKLFSARTATESRWCYIISLFHVIGASVLTTSMSFGFIFVMYVLLMVFSLLLYTLRRESEISEKAAARLQHEAIGRIIGRNTMPRLRIPWALRARVPRGLTWSALLLTLCVMIIAAGTFAVVPRLQTQNLFQGYGTAPEKPQLTAFDESIEFGTFERIQLNNAVALFAQPQGPDRPDHIRLRGVALDTFDGRAWRRTSPSTDAQGRHEFRRFTTRRYDRRYTYRIIQPPGITNYLFADTFPESINVGNDVSFRVDNYSNAAWLFSMLPKEFQYVSTSLVEHLDDRIDPVLLSEPENASSVFNMVPARDETREKFQNLVNSFSQIKSAFADGKGSKDIAAQLDEQQARRARDRRARLNRDLRIYLDRCTSVPEVLQSPAIAQLARDWANDSATTFAKALAIERRLRRDYGYSLEPKARGNFIEDFLFRTKEGHCEYFATSMAILLRSLGIPARVVNGYYCVEWNNIGNNFTVRQKDAHSWVEAWMGDGYGWMTFEATPPSGVGRTHQQSAVAQAISRVSDAMRVRWYRYIVDYSASDQATIMQTLMKVRRQMNNALENLRKLSQLLPKFSGSSSNGDAGPLLNLLLASLLVITGSLIVFMRLRHWRPSHRRRRANTSVRFYQEILKQLGRINYRLLPGETPREFAQRLTLVEELAPMADVTEFYYRTRYHNQRLSPEELGMVQQFRNSLKNMKPRQN